MIRLVMASTLFFATACNHHSDEMPLKNGSESRIQSFDGFVHSMGGVELAPPAYAVAVATSEDILYQRTVGPRVLGGDEMVDIHTPYYVASITKSFVGTLAAELNRKGVLSLDMTLANALPDLELPQGLDPETIRLRELLSHQSRIISDPVSNRTAYIGYDEDFDVVEAFNATSTQSEKFFEYSNEGYLLYAEILFRHTGKDWRTWLDEIIHGPLSLNESSTRMSTLGPDAVVWGNRLTFANQGGWEAVAPKDDSIMHPAGGHYMTLADTIAWLQHNMRSKGILSEAFEKAHESEFFHREGETTKYLDMNCDEYALGWRVCEYAGRKVYYHGGTYTGALSFISFMPEEDLAVSVYVGSDHYGFVFGIFTMLQAYDELLSVEEAAENATRRIDRFRNATHRLYRSKAQRREKSIIDLFEPWSPTRAEEQKFIGRYAHPVLGTLTLSKTQDGYSLENGRRTAILQPTDSWSFVTYFDSLDEPLPLRINLSTDGSVNSISWSQDEFIRQN